MACKAVLDEIQTNTEWVNDAVESELEAHERTNMTERNPIEPRFLGNDALAVELKNLTPFNDEDRAVLDAAADRLEMDEASFARIATKRNADDVELSRMISERDAARAELARVNAERDDIKAELDAVTKERDKARCQLDELATFRENARNRDCERERLARVQKELADVKAERDDARAKLARLRYSVAGSVGNADRHDMFAAAALTGLLASDHDANVTKAIAVSAAREIADAMVAPRDIEDAPHATGDAKPTREELLDALDGIARSRAGGVRGDWFLAFDDRDVNALCLLVAAGRWERHPHGMRRFRPILAVPTALASNDQ